MKKKGRFCIYILGVDPGLKGSFCVTDGSDFVKFREMPLNSEKRVDFGKVKETLKALSLNGVVRTVYLERAKPLAMGSKYAFNYGRDYECIYRALLEMGFTVIEVEPSHWAKVMHEGIDKNLRPKAKSQIAVKKWFPRLVAEIPKRPRAGDFEEGPMDALLIAGFGLREYADFF